MPFISKICSILLWSAFFFAQICRFLAEIISLLKVIILEPCCSFLSYVFSFFKVKRDYWWKCKFMDHASQIRPPDVCNFSISFFSKKSDATSCRHYVIIEIFCNRSVSPFKFCYCSRFHVNMMTGSGVKTILVYKELTENPEIRKTNVWILPNIWKVVRVRIPKSNVSH